MSNNKQHYEISTVDAEAFKADGERTIEILLRDKETKEILGSKIVKRAFLAKCMAPLSNEVITAYQGKFVLEV